jgi:hypothetical protein
VVRFSGIPAFLPDRRGNRVLRHLVTRDEEGPRQWLYLCGPEEAAAQIEAVSGDRSIRTEVTKHYATQYSHRFQFDAGVSADIRDLVNLLEDVVTLTGRPALDFAIALDWYKAPDDDLEPMNWPNTEVGELVHHGKYYGRLEARQELASRMGSVIARHPLYSRAESIITCPGSRADRNSFGESLARLVAKGAGKELVEAESRIGPREAQKAGGQRDLTGVFELPMSAPETVIVLDDVYKTGSTLSGVAEASRRAGARRVLGLAAVRTMRAS